MIATPIDLKSSVIFQRDLFLNEKLLFILLVIAAPIQETASISYEVFLGIKFAISLLFIGVFAISDYKLLFKIENDTIEIKLFYLILAVLISTITSFNVSTSIPHLFRLIFILFLFRSLRLFFAEKKNTELFFQGVIIIGLFVGVMGLLEQGNVLVRSRSLFANANSLGQFSSIILLVIIFKLLFSEKNKNYFVVISVITVTVLLATMIFSFSRSSWVLFFIGTVILFSYKFGKKIIPYWFLAIIFSTIIYFTFQEEVNLLLRIDRLITFRDEIWDIAFRVFKDNFIFGVGPGNLPSQIGYYFTAPPSIIRTIVYTINFSAHNDFLQILSEIGIVGFLFYLLFLSSVAKKLFTEISKNKNDNSISKNSILAFSIFVGFMFASFFETSFLFGSFSIAIYFWITVAMTFPLVEEKP